MSRTRTLLLAVLGVLAACEGNGGVQPFSPGLTVVSGDGITDTVNVAVPQPLVVRVANPVGVPLAGVRVEFIGGAGIAGIPGRYHTIAGPSPSITDRDGLARAKVFLGTIAGEDSVTVQVPTLRLTAYAHYTVLPGHPAGVVVEPADTAVYVSGTVALRGSVVDRWQNALAGTVTYLTSSAALQLAGTTLTGAAIGRASVVATSGVWQDTAWVSVVPQGAAVAVLPHRVSYDTQRVVSFNFDGTAFHSFDVSYWATPLPDWSPAGDVMVLEDGGPFPGDNPRLMIADPSGPIRKLVPDSLGFTAEREPRYSVDGSWIYFSATRPGLPPAIWRIHPDGSGAEPAAGLADYSPYGADLASPSPDGSRIAYTMPAVCCYDRLLYVIHTANGAVDTLLHANGTPFPGYRPRWSPVADVIVYARHNDNEPQQYASYLMLINPDGSNERPASNASDMYLPEMDWSPDGRWLIARSYDDPRLHLIDTQTGLTLPLAFTNDLRQPAWRAQNFPSAQRALLPTRK